MKYDFKKLKTAREEKLLTQGEVAEMAGISRTAVNEVETGRAPWKKAIRAMAAVLGVPVEDLIVRPKPRRKLSRRRIA